MDGVLIAGSSPHITSKVTTKRIMLDVIIALLPAVLASVYFFGVYSLLMIIVSVISCVLAEDLWCRVLKKPNTVGDLSAVVTGILLALNLSSSVPLWIVMVGGVFAIVIVKQFFGGLGYNFVNPALAARAFLMASWPVYMTTWKAPFTDTVSSATPLALIKVNGEALGSLPTILDLVIGKVEGCIGETSVIAIVIGAIYLLIRRVISFEIPCCFILTVAVVTWIFGGYKPFTGDFLYHICAGGLMLGAFFMATDYTTSPITVEGKVIMGVGCGLITAVIRIFGGYPEGVSYSILIMNLFVPLIDKYIVPKSFGSIRKKRKKALS